MYAIFWLWNVLFCISSLHCSIFAEVLQRENNFVSWQRIFFRMHRHKAPERNWSKMNKFFISCVCVFVSRDEFLSVWSNKVKVDRQADAAPHTYWNSVENSNQFWRTKSSIYTAAWGLDNWSSLKSLRACEFPPMPVGAVLIIHPAMLIISIFIQSHGVPSLISEHSFLCILIKLCRSRSNLRHKIYDQFNRERLNVITLTASSLQPRLKFFMLFTASHFPLILAPIIC